MAIIEVNHVTKEYQLGQLHSLKQSALDAFARVRGNPVRGRVPFRALDDVDFKVEEGEVLGIIGHNGAGKSTLLKLLAGISKPTKGTIVVRGKVAPLIEVGAGLVPDLTGRENVFLNATILGMRRAEISKKFDEIVAFAELGDFIDTPIKRYSSGMQVRLGFAIATAVDADLLIIDEVLAVGDMSFQRKCFDRMEGMIKDEGKTVLVVSHNIRQVERLCQRAILLEHGRIDKDGFPPQVCDEFYRRSERHARQSSEKRAETARRESSGEIDLLDVAVLDADDATTSEITQGSGLTIRVAYKVNAILTRPVFGVGIHTPDFLYLATAHSDSGLSLENLAPGSYELLFHIPHFPFLPGVYCVRVGVAVGNLYSTALYAENVISFQVTSTSVRWAESIREGIVPLEGDWSMQAADGHGAGRVAMPTEDASLHESPRAATQLSIAQSRK